MLLKGALHVHTTCSDGELTVAEAAAVYRELGFDFIALTDHDYLLRPDCYEAARQVRTDLVIFTGVELTIFEKGYLHISRIDGDDEVLHIFNHPSGLNLPVEQVKDRIETVARQLPIDAVEVTTNGFRTPEYDIAEIPYPKVATDDSHTRLGCGRAWIEMDCERDKDEIIRAIRRGDFWNCYAASHRNVREAS
jgi:predicted metal-dependent phosphoesterase TrpH